VEASAAAVAASSQLAKRQLTWLRRDRDVTLLGDTSVGVLEALTAKICVAACA
jgi:tRNA A37 N6-isopentenylltransferase MiaA